jgi:hypothetical protein
MHKWHYTTRFLGRAGGHAPAVHSVSVFESSQPNLHTHEIKWNYGITTRSDMTRAALSDCLSKFRFQATVFAHSPLSFSVKLHVPLPQVLQSDSS